MSRSVIWTAFGNDGAGANDDTAQCKLCMKKVKHSGNTKNLWQHYERHHKDEYKKLMGMEKERQSADSKVG